MQQHRLYYLSSFQKPWGNRDTTLSWFLASLHFVPPRALTTIRGYETQIAIFISSIRSLVGSSSIKRFYHIIIGHHGVGKTTLLEMVIKSIESPKGIVYIGMKVGEDSPPLLNKSLSKAIGWVADPGCLIQESVSIQNVHEANGVSAPSLHEILKLFYTAAYRFGKEHEKIPVLVIENANSEAQMKLI